MIGSAILKEGKNILTAHHIGNILLSVAFCILKSTRLCAVVFGCEEDQCGLDRREHEVLVFVCVVVLVKNRKACNWLHFLSTAFLFSKMANVYLFLRAEPLVGTIYVLICLAHAVLFPEPAYTGPERITYFTADQLHKEIERNKRITWMVQFYTTWSPQCKHIAPVFSQLSNRFALPNLRFAKLDVGRWPKEAERFRINIHPASRQLPTMSLFKEGKEVLRKPTISNKRAIPFVFNQDNCILEFDLNNIYNDCKANMNKHDKDEVKRELQDKKNE